MDAILRHLDQLERDRVRDLERELPGLRSRAEASRDCTVLGPGFAQSLGRAERALESLRRSIDERERQFGRGSRILY